MKEYIKNLKNLLNSLGFFRLLNNHLMGCGVFSGIFETQHSAVQNLTSFLHEDEELIKEFLSLWVVIQFVKLEIKEQYHQCAVYSVLHLGSLMKGGGKRETLWDPTATGGGGLMSNNHFLILLMFKMLP